MSRAILLSVVLLVGCALEPGEMCPPRIGFSERFERLRMAEVFGKRCPVCMCACGWEDGRPMRHVGLDEATWCEGGER